MLDNTEEFFEREQPTKSRSTLPSPAEIEYIRDMPVEPPPQLAALTRMLQGLPESMPVADAVVGGDFSSASYRLSLLTFIGEQNVDPELELLAALPLTINWSDELIEVRRSDVARLSRGTLTRKQNE
jgi:hypothetical protein